MTTVAKNEEGQSLLEFLLVLPVLLGLVALMTRVNTAIQASLVYQQYARAQTTFLTFNSPVYPSLRLQASELNGKNYNQMTIGVSDNLITGDSNLPLARSFAFGTPSRCARKPTYREAIPFCRSP